MRGLIQRVSSASVCVEGECVGDIGRGLLLLLGVQQGDGEPQADKLLHKIMNYRVFGDEQGKMNLSVKDIRGDVLVVSQFTLAANTAKGLRPGFSAAAEPLHAQSLYDYFVIQARQATAGYDMSVEAGTFAADMQVASVNDGPVTFLLES